MRASLITIILIATHSILLCGAPAAGGSGRPFDTTRCRLVWSDEFDGTTLNRDIWNVEVSGNGGGNNELQYYVDSLANVRVADDCLVITARRGDHLGKPFTSGRVNTLGKYHFTYGLVEARIRLPRTADGLWPAFWLMGADISQIGWPRCGETDVLEMGHADGIAAGTQDRLFNGALHYGTGCHKFYDSHRSNEYSLQDGEFHSFYLLWTPAAISMWVDDQAEPYLSLDITHSDDPDMPGYYFHKPNFLLVNLAVGGDFTGIHDPDGVTAPDDRNSLMVDYIRVYEYPNNNHTDN